MLHPRRAIVAFILCILAACSDKTILTPQDPEATGLRILAGEGGTDTISTQFTQALVVELRDEQGLLLPNHVIRFSTVVADPTRPTMGNSAYVSAVDRNDLRTFLADTTDDRGRARALVTLGVKAGSAMVIVSDPDHGVADTATFTVQPGRPVAVVASPRDTAVYVGKTATLRNSVVDRAGNPRSDPVTHSVIGSAVTMAGSTMTAVGLGLAKVVTSAGTMSDTTNVTVPPEGTLAAFTPQGLAMFNTDGSGFRVLAAGVNAFNGLTSAWSPSGTEVAFDRSCCATAIQIANVTTGVRTVTPSASTSLYPEFSRDGQWMYYSRSGWRLYRVHPDGSGDELVPMLTPYSDAASTLSPDGARLIYVRIGFPDQLWTLDLATGQSTDLHVFGHQPAWSPTGNVIAFIANGESNTIKVMNPDGTGVRTLTLSGAPYAFGLDWSPDGQWIVARSFARDRLELINATSGEIIPLSYTRGYGGPSWKP